MLPTTWHNQILNKKTKSLKARCEVENKSPFLHCGAALNLLFFVSLQLVAAISSANSYFKLRAIAKLNFGEGLYPASKEVFVTELDILPSPVEFRQSYESHEVSA